MGLVVVHPTLITREPPCSFAALLPLDRHDVRRRSREVLLGEIAERRRDALARQAGLLLATHRHDFAPGLLAQVEIGGQRRPVLEEGAIAAYHAPGGAGVAPVVVPPLPAGEGEVD